MPTLHDGREVASDSEDWKLECLARHVLRLPNRAAINGWLLDFSRLHGEAAERILRARLNAVRDGDASGRRVTKNVTTKSRRLEPSQSKDQESDLFCQI